MNVHDTRLDENGNVFTVEARVEPYPSLTDQLLDQLLAQMAWTREARENDKLKAKLKREKKIFRQLRKGTKEVTAELEQRVAQLSDAKTELDQKEAQLRNAKKELSQIFIVAERRERQIRHLQNVVGKLQEKRDELQKKMDQEIDWEANYYNELKQNELLAEKVAQLESAMTEMKPCTEIDWEGGYRDELARNRLLAEKVARLEQDLKDSREDNVMFPKGTLVIFPAGSELRFL